MGQKVLAKAKRKGSCSPPALLVIAATVVSNSRKFVKINYLGILIIVFVVTSCNYIDCNYEKLTDNEYVKIAELNRNAKRIDTLFNDKCLKGYVHVYLKTESSDLAMENEIKGIIAELKNENMERDIWVFNNQESFLYRLFYDNSKDDILKTDLQYPNE